MIIKSIFNLIYYLIFIKKKMEEKKVACFMGSGDLN